MKKSTLNTIKGMRDNMIKAMGRDSMRECPPEIRMQLRESLIVIDAVWAKADTEFRRGELQL